MDVAEEKNYLRCPVIIERKLILWGVAIKEIGVVTICQLRAGGRRGGRLEKCQSGIVSNEREAMITGHGPRVRARWIPSTDQYYKTLKKNLWGERKYGKTIWVMPKDLGAKLMKKTLNFNDIKTVEKRPFQGEEKGSVKTVMLDEYWSCWKRVRVVGRVRIDIAGDYYN